MAAFLGGTMADALRATDEMAAICAGTSSRFTHARLGPSPGTPLGVDVRRVVEHGITPKVTTGILHASAGTGQVGAGVAEAPLALLPGGAAGAGPPPRMKRPVPERGPP